jgi:hypothetical protein
LYFTIKGPITRVSLSLASAASLLICLTPAATPQS